jgi:hypothetical protein
MTDNLVPVVLRQRIQTKREDYVSTVCLLADEKGNFLAAGTAFQSPLDNHCKSIGRVVAIGRAVKAFAEGKVNGEILGTSIHLERVNHQLGYKLFDQCKSALAITSIQEVMLPPHLQEMVNEAVAHKTRLAVDLETQKFHFITKK